MRGAVRAAVTLALVLAVVVGLALAAPWRAMHPSGVDAQSPAAALPSLPPVSASVPPVVLPEPVLVVPSVEAATPPPAAPAPGPELSAGLAAAAAVPWAAPSERPELADGAPASAPPRPVLVKGCRNNLVQLLAFVGFKGENIREAWAIAMRESGGRSAVGPGDPTFNGADWGMFQLNRPTYFTQPWWNDSALLDGEYNARVAFYLSRGGMSWYPWGLDGHGNTKADAYSSIWTPQMIYDRITKPYQYWYSQFPCLV